MRGGVKEPGIPSQIPPLAFWARMHQDINLAFDARLDDRKKPNEKGRAFLTDIRYLPRECFRAFRFNRIKLPEFVNFDGEFNSPTPPHDEFTKLAGRERASQIKADTRARPCSGTAIR